MSSVYTAINILTSRLCTNGVFEYGGGTFFGQWLTRPLCFCSRFPKLKVIVGHFGERLPSDLFRIDQRQLFH